MAAAGANLFGNLQGREVSTRRRLTIRRLTGGSESESSDSTYRNWVNGMPLCQFSMMTYNFSLFSRSCLWTSQQTRSEKLGEIFSQRTLRLNPYSSGLALM